MVSSVKPWALAKAVNFSFTSALGVWVRPAQEGKAGVGVGGGLRSAPPPAGAAQPPPPPPRAGPCVPGRAGAPTVESGHVEVLAWALGARGVEQSVVLVVRLHHPHVIHAAPVWDPTRRPQSGPPDRWPWEGVVSEGGLPSLPLPYSGIWPAPCFLPAQPVNSARWGPVSPSQKSWGPAHTQPQKIRGSCCCHHPFGWPGRGKVPQWGSHRGEGVRTPHEPWLCVTCPPSRDGTAKVWGPSTQAQGGALQETAPEWSSVPHT